MGHIFNRKLLLTLTTLAYAFNVSAAQATKLNDEESFSSRAYSLAKTAAYGTAKVGAYGAATAATFVAGVTGYEAERETLLHAKNQILHHSSEAGLFLADKAVKAFKLTSWVLSKGYNAAYETYMPYHPTVCHYASELSRLSSEGLEALQQTVTEHPYVSAGVAVTFAVSIGAVYLYGKSKTAHATKLMEEKEATALKEKRRIEAENARLEKQVKELQSAKQHTPSPTSIITHTHPSSKSDNKGKVTSNPITTGGHGGNVTFNLLMTPDMLKGVGPKTSQKVSTIEGGREVILIEG